MKEKLTIEYPFICRKCNTKYTIDEYMIYRSCCNNHNTPTILWLAKT